MQNDAAHPAGTPPYGTAQRIRTRAIWAVALFTASLPPALIGFGIATATADQTNLAMPLAFLFWATGLLFALWAAFPALRYWDGLPGQVRCSRSRCSSASPWSAPCWFDPRISIGAPFANQSQSRQYLTRSCLRFIKAMNRPATKMCLLCTRQPD